MPTDSLLIAQFPQVHCPNKENATIGIYLNQSNNIPTHFETYSVMNKNDSRICVFLEYC